jgi:methionine biosynthesis protein MetW
MANEPQAFSKNEEYYQYVRHDLVKLVQTIHGSVLEIGCAQGLTLDYLRSNFDCTVTGVDYCDDAIRIARSKGLNVIRCDLNNELLPLTAQKYDYILVGDVLEHLYDPWRILKDLTIYLKDGGRMLISMPNIKHYSVVRDLICNDKWEYQKLGQLDVTHIRFFTLTELRKLVEKSGLVIETVECNLAASFKMRWLNRLFFNKLHSFLVSQYLVCAKKQ